MKQRSNFIVFDLKNLRSMIQLYKNVAVTDWVKCFDANINYFESISQSFPDDDSLDRMFLPLLPDLSLSPGYIDDDLSNAPKEFRDQFDITIRGSFANMVYVYILSHHIIMRLNGDDLLTLDLTSFAAIASAMEFGIPFSEKLKQAIRYDEKLYAIRGEYFRLLQRFNHSLEIIDSGIVDSGSPVLN